VAAVGGGVGISGEETDAWLVGCAVAGGFDFRETEDPVERREQIQGLLDLTGLPPSERLGDIFNRFAPNSVSVLHEDGARELVAAGVKLGGT